MCGQFGLQCGPEATPGGLSTIDMAYWCSCRSSSLCHFVIFFVCVHFCQLNQLHHKICPTISHWIINPISHTYWARQSIVNFANPNPQKGNTSSLRMCFEPGQSGCQGIWWDTLWLISFLSHPWPILHSLHPPQPPCQLNNNRVPALVIDSLPNCIHSLMTIWLKYYAKVSPPVCSPPPNLILI